MRLLCVFVVLLVAILLPLHVNGIPKPSLAKPASHYHGRHIIAANTGRDSAYPARSTVSNDHGAGDSRLERAPKDLVVYYTRNVKLRALVAVVAAITLAVLVHILSTFLFSASSVWVLWAVAAFAIASAFLKGDAGDFSRSVGVCVLLLSQRTSCAKFLVKFVSQLKGMLRLSSRRPFPPGSNPWQYPAEGETDLQFGMMGVLASAVLSAAYIGWLVGRIVPLLPNWIGALSAACTAGYLTTLQDGRGDMLRYLGYSLSRCIAVLSDTLEDVQLRDRAGAVLGHVLFFSQTVDSKYKLVARLQAVLAELISRLTMLIARLRRDMSGAPATHPRTHYVPRADAPGEYYSYPKDEYAGGRDAYDGDRRGVRGVRNTYREGGPASSSVHESAQYEEPGNHGANYEQGPGQRSYKPKVTSKESWWR